MERASGGMDIGDWQEPVPLYSWADQDRKEGLAIEVLKKSTVESFLFSAITK
ncbi:hypothetical protein ACFLXV_03565 [Chloroflexota bacterium]